jgi:hypothetical protein
MKASVLLLLLLCVSPVFSQEKLSSTDMRADFDVLRKALEEAHGGLYRFVSKSDMDKRFDAYDQKLSEPKTQFEFIAILSEVLTEIRDGHAQLEFDDLTNEKITAARMLPLRLQIEGSKLIVMFNDTPDNTTVKPGMEIKSINGHATSELIPSFMKKTSGDGFIETGKLRRVERSFPRFYWLFMDQSSSFTVTTEQEGKTISVDLEGVVSTDRMKNRTSNPVNAAIIKNAGPTENIILKQLDNNTASLTIRGFQGGDFRSTLDSLMLVLKEKDANTLILDLRENGGGVDEYGAYLVSQFTTKPFRYFDRIHLKSINPSFATWKPSTYENLQNNTIPDPAGGFLVTTKLHSGVGEQAPAKNPFTGRLFVLMNGNSFSTTADVTAVLRQMKRAIFIGEECGGAAEGNISGLNARVKLPYSKLSTKVQMYEYWNAVTPKQKGRGTLPNYEVEPTVSDLLKGVDACMNKALELAKND